MDRKTTLDSLKQVTVRSRAQLRTWLEKNHLATTSIWLVTYKKGSKHYIAYDDIVEEALCFGWIDSLPRKLDEQRTMRMLSPRRPRSAWSKINKDRIERLTADGLIHSSGLAKIEQAKLDGSWNRLDDSEIETIPEELSKALAADPKAREGFDKLTDSLRRRLLHYLNEAKGPSTRRKRVETILTLSRARLKTRSAG